MSFQVMENNKPALPKIIGGLRSVSDLTLHFCQEPSSIWEAEVSTVANGSVESGEEWIAVILLLGSTFLSFPNEFLEWD